MIFKVLRFFLLAVVLGSVGAHPAFAGFQENADLTSAASRFLDFPSNICTLHILHTAVAQEYALLSWQCGDGGGELLLQYQQNSWQTLSIDGGVFGSTELIEKSVPEDVAVQLIQQLQAQWPEASNETP